MDNSDKGFLQEDNGSWSCMRLMSFIALFASIVFAYITLHLPMDNGTGLYLTLAFLMGAFCPKIVQKFAEEKVLPTIPNPK